MYSKVTVQLSKRTIQAIVSRRTTRTLSANEEPLVEDAILNVRGRNEYISLYTIDRTLKELEDAGHIDKFDRRDLMKAFESHIKKTATDG
jgi:Fe2+ or Zn2+ uptake regulation protein